MEYDSGLRKETLPFATTWMGPEGFMKSAIRQRKANTASSHLHGEPKNNRSKLSSENRLVVARVGRGVDEIE